MIKPVPILNLYITSNFLEGANNDGRRIDTSTAICSLAPEPSLELIIKNLQGLIVSEKNKLQVYMPVNLPVVEQPFMELMPDKLFFYLAGSRSDMLSFSGLSFTRKMMFLEPNNALFKYTYRRRSIDCRACGREQIISDDDLVNIISANASIDEISKLAEKPLNTKNKVLDVQLVIDGDAHLLSDLNSLQKCQKVLAGKTFKKIELSIERAGGGIVLKHFSEILVVPGDLDKSIIGIVAIPLSSIMLEDVESEPYQFKNSFIIHFPVVQTKVELTVNTTLWTGDSKLFFLGEQVKNPTVSNHPYLPSTKQLKATINQVSFFYADPANVEIHYKPDAKIRSRMIRVEPFAYYESQTSTSRINVQV